MAESVYEKRARDRNLKELDWKRSRSGTPRLRSAAELAQDCYASAVSMLSGCREWLPLKYHA